RVATPGIGDVLSSNTTDTSCYCRETGNCAQVSDAVAGFVEGRNLSCRAGAEGNAAVCSFEERFVNQEGKQVAIGPWLPKDSTFKKLPDGSWCEV
ncbi:MAG: hypothetical protein LC648_01195, partial [Novosphingobium sp.]|nr:hypothetical protein [Novosphingobium sp.]